MLCLVNFLIGDAEYSRTPSHHYVGENISSKVLN